MMNVRLGICDWALPGGGLYGPRIAADAGLDALALKIGEYANNYPISEPEMQKYYLQEQDHCGIEYCALALNDYDNIPMHAPENTPDYERIMEIARRAIQTVRALHIPMIQVPAFAQSAIETEEQMARSAKVLRLLCEEAGALGVTVSHEGLLSPEEFKTLYEMVGQKNFGVYFDSQNYFLFKGWDEVEVLHGFYPYMVDQLHVKDGAGAMSGALLGKGDSGFYQTMAALKDKGFEGVILLENYYDQLPLRLAGESPYALLKEDIAILKAAL
ncbi:MAG: TIM barrel protein [Christensenellales bacterium]|jgi:sugar phosphate isomerase/epimerase